MRKLVGGFGKKSCVSTGVKKPGNTCICITDCHNNKIMTLAVKVALNQPTRFGKAVWNIQGIPLVPNQGQPSTSV